MHADKCLHGAAPPDRDQMKVGDLAKATAEWVPVGLVGRYVRKLSSYETLTLVDYVKQAVNVNTMPHAHAVDRADAELQRRQDN